MARLGVSHLIRAFDRSRPDRMPRVDDRRANVAASYRYIRETLGIGGK
jgi:hypothetical protein